MARRYSVVSLSAKTTWLLGSKGDRVLVERCDFDAPAAVIRIDQALDEPEKRVSPVSNQSVGSWVFYRTSKHHPETDLWKRNTGT